MIAPIVRCRQMAQSLPFYTQVLDFKLRSVWPMGGDPALAVLTRDGCELHLSSHSGDGVFGQAIAVLEPDVDAVFARFAALDYRGERKPQSPVHQGPVDQTWGTREFHVDDPDGNTVRYIQRL